MKINDRVVVWFIDLPISKTLYIGLLSFYRESGFAFLNFHLNLFGFFSKLFIGGVHLFLYIVVILRGVILPGVITEDKTEYREDVIGCFCGFFLLIIYRLLLHWFYFSC